MLDSMASRYGMLPTQVLATATTLDIYVLEKALAYTNRAKDPDYDPSKPNLTQEQMKAMIEQVRKTQR